MGGVCSRKRDQQQVKEERTGKYSKSSSSKWLRTSFRLGADLLPPPLCPSLFQLCVLQVCKDIQNYQSFAMLPRDITQQIFDALVDSHSLTHASLQAFRDCAIQDICLPDYPGVDDIWIDVIRSQGSSLLSVDLSASDVTDSALDRLAEDCRNLQQLTFNYSNQISDNALKHIAGFANLTSLSLTKNNAITAQGLCALAKLSNLVNLDLGRCSGIHGGLVHLKGLTRLESLNLRCCNCITDSDMKPLSGLTNLKELQISCSKVTDLGVAYLKDLKKLVLLNMEGCPVTAACLGSISALGALAYLNLNRCNISDGGCEKFCGLENLRVLNLGFNNITDAFLVHLKGITVGKYSQERLLFSLESKVHLDPKEFVQSVMLKVRHNGDIDMINRFFVMLVGAETKRKGCLLWVLYAEQKLKSKLGADTDESLQIFLDIGGLHTKAAEESMKKHSDELFAKLGHMELQLEKYLNVITSKCRKMTTVEKKELCKLIRNLPPKNLDRVVDIIIQRRKLPMERPCNEICVDLENEDNVTLWRLYYYVEAVSRARLCGSSF